MAISSPINITNVSQGFRSLRIGLGRIKKSAESIRSILFKKTTVKQQAITGKKSLQTKRKENALRKEQEDILEASGIKPTAKKTRTAIVDSAKGFLGRILDFIGTLFVGWLIYNLPTLIAMTKDLIIRIKTLFGALSGFIGDIFNIFGDVGRILTGVLSDIKHLDLFDTHKRVQNAFNDLNTHFDDMGKQFEDGVKSVTTPLGKGKGEEKIPPTGTPVGGGPAFGQPGSSTKVTGTEQEKVEKVLGSYEGSKLKAYKDSKGIWTIGEGNTMINGRPVKEGDTITAEQSIQMKRSAIEDHRQRAINQVGLQKWNSLPENTRVALTSLVYNYGSIPSRVLPAVRSGDSEKIANAIEGLSGDDGGINAWRRKDEAKIIRTGTSSRVSLSQGQRASTQSQGSTPQDSAPGGGNLINVGKSILNEGFTIGENHYFTNNKWTKFLPNPGGFTPKGNSPVSGHANNADHAEHSLDITDWRGSESSGYPRLTELFKRLYSVKNQYNITQLIFDPYGYWFAGQSGITHAAYGGHANHLHVRFGGAASAAIRGGNTGAIAAINSQGSGTDIGAITPERRGTTVAVVDNRQPQQPPSGGGGGAGGGGAAASLISFSDALNSLIKKQILLELAYT